MQTQRDIVKAAIHFRKPERLPIMFECFGENDVADVGWNQIGTGDHNQRFTYDEWGCGWSRSEVENMGLVTFHPLLDWDNLDSFKFPDPHNPAFYEGMEEKVAAIGDKYAMTGIFMLLFERMHSLRGFENTLLDLYIEPEKIADLADKIVDFNIAVINEIGNRFPGKIDGFNFSDDWGTELALFISPALWKEFFKPRYKKIFDACHSFGWDVWMHSCGKVNEIIEDLIEIGCNVMNLQQPCALGIEEIGKRFAGRIAFQSLCDIQHTLPFKSDEEIRQEATMLLDNWATKDGGFILSDYGDGAAIGVPLSKKQVMFDEFKRYAKTIW